MGVGLSIAGGRLVVAILIAAYLGTTLTAAIRSEEADLRRAFGDKYERYRRQRAVDTTRPVKSFSTGRAIANGEARTLLGLAAVMLLLLWKATYN
jgi:hypothetical protein